MAKSRGKSLVTVLTLLMSAAALGVSVWAIIQTNANTADQARSQAKAAALAAAQDVQFVGGTIVKNKKTVIEVEIENYEKYPLVEDEVQWQGSAVKYPLLNSCYEFVLEAPTTTYKNVDQYLRSATLFYITPDGNEWARSLNGYPHTATGPIDYPFSSVSETRMATCAAASP